MKKIPVLKKHGLGNSKLVLIVIAIAAGGLIMWQRQHHKVSTPVATAPSGQPTTPETTNPGTPPTKDPGSFDIGAFYNNLQDNMTSEQIVKLANKQPDDCALTDSVPASRTCIWYSGDNSVTIYYGQTDTLKSKSKSGF